MIADARQFSQRPDVSDGFRIGVTTGLRPIPAWKHEADFLLTQVSFSARNLIRWRATHGFAGPVYAGVMVLPSASMARKLSAEVPQLAVPESVVGRIDDDHSAGVTIACELIEQIRESNAFDGVHLIPVNRYREIAARLESMV
jgi:5,10-methylenetetrahydrofolate reductase